MKAESGAQDKEIEILQHTILYYYGNGQDMPEHGQEHVKKMIINGYWMGKLCDLDEQGKDISGCWEISGD